MSGDQPWPAWAIERIEVVDADPSWADRGEQERSHVQLLLAPWLTARVEHIGSTAIPDLAAKPIIDLQAAVADLGDADSIATALAPHEWHYVAPEFDHRLWQRFFVKVANGRRSAHLHVMTIDSAHWSERTAFRDVLRAEPVLAAEYGGLKRALAAEQASDREAYTGAKADFVHSVLKRWTQQEPRSG